jgi:NitT/TauT family transport system substrate-binding protein
MAAFALAVTACAGGDSAGSADELSIGVPGQPPVFLSLPAFVARDMGFFADQGLDVTIRPFETGADALRGLVAGEVDMSISPTGLGVQLAGGEAQDLRFIWGMENSNFLVGSIDPAVTRCEDLAGQTIGVDSVGGARYIGLAAMMRACGLDLRAGDASTSNFPGIAAVQAMSAGQLRVSVLQFEEVALVNSQRTEPVTIVTNIAEVDPFAHYMIGGVLQSTIDERRDVLVRVLAGMREAIAFIVDPANRDRVAEIASEMTGYSVEDAGDALDLLLRIDFWSATTAGLDVGKIQTSIDRNVAAGNLTEATAPDVAVTVDASLYDEAVGLG